MSVFSAAEEQGYTVGINYRSREVLLEGWRKYMAGAQQNLPSAAQKPKSKDR